MNLRLKALALAALVLSPLSALAGNATSISISSTGNAVPGKPIALSATLSGGPFELMQPNGAPGGTIYFYDGATVIGQVTLSTSTGQNGYFYNDVVYIMNADGSISAVTFRYVLSQLSTVAINYTLPNQPGPHTFHAAFAPGSDKFSDGSSSNPITVTARYNSNAAVIDFILSN